MKMSEEILFSNFGDRRKGNWKPVEGKRYVSIADERLSSKKVDTFVGMC